MADRNHTTCCAGIAVAHAHIVRAAGLLSAARHTSLLTGAVYREALQMALQSLGEASAAIEIRTAEVTHG